MIKKCSPSFSKRSVHNVSVGSHPSWHHQLVPGRPTASLSWSHSPRSQAHQGQPKQWPCSERRSHTVERPGEGRGVRKKKRMQRNGGVMPATWSHRTMPYLKYNDKAEPCHHDLVEWQGSWSFGGDLASEPFRDARKELYIGSKKRTKHICNGFFGSTFGEKIVCVTISV